MFLRLKVRFQVFQARMPGVLVRKDDAVGRYLPVDAQVRVVEQQAAFQLGMVQVVALVGEDGSGAEHGKTVRESLRNQVLQVVFSGQFHNCP